MITLLPDADRGRTRLAWLDSAHSFSFGDYHNPERTGFGVIRVLNEDRVQPGRGFATHGHANMEILSWVIGGELLHRDSTGGASRLPRGSLQVMSAGAGIRHSEQNGSDRQSLHFLQVWLQPDRVNGAPAWSERSYSDDELRNRLCLLASPDMAEDALPIRQNTRVLASRLAIGKSLEYGLSDRRRAWIQVVHGRLQLADVTLNAGDGASIEHLRCLPITSSSADCEFLLFDLP